MKRFLLLLLTMTVALISFGQGFSVTFTGTGAATNVDSVTATNLSTGEKVTLPGSATLILTPKTGIPYMSMDAASGIVFPNPFSGATSLIASLPESGRVHVQVQNIGGQIVAQTEAETQPGENEFVLSMNAPGIYIVTLESNSTFVSYKVICTAATESENRIQYAGTPSGYKAVSSRSGLKSSQSGYSLGYSSGEIIHYQCTSGVYVTIMTDSPMASKTYDVEFKACTDPDGKSYPIVKIGDQTWMAENLAYLPVITPPSIGYNGDPFYYVYGNEETNIAAAKNNSNYQDYGVLYNWLAVMNGSASSNSVPGGVQGICPTGWHLPSYAEWSVLSDYLGSNAGGKLKENGDNHWTSPNEEATNETGFAARPGGYRNSGGEFLETGNMSFFWSSTEFDKGLAYFQGLYYDSGDITFDGSPTEYGFSVRCLKNDSDAVVLPTVTTSGTSLVKSESAAAGGCVTNDGNTTNTVRGVCWSANENPTTDDPKTTDGTGTGAFISDLTGLAPNTTYYFRSYATNSAGTAYGEQKSLKTTETGGYGTFTDIRNGRKYRYTVIGTQSWMAENLDYLPAVSPFSVGSASEKHYYVYGYEGSLVSQAKVHENYQSYGALYNWEAASTACPPGWNLATDEEWKILERNLGMSSAEADLMDYRGSGSVGGQLKETGTSHWNSPNTDASNSSRFSALPGGCRKLIGFEYLGTIGDYWTASESITSNVYSRAIEYNNGGVWRMEVSKSYYGMAVRCIKVSENANTPPKASFTISPETRTTETKFELDASSSTDAETATDDLEVRWDFDADGNWDTDYDVLKTFNLQFPSPGAVTIILEVKDAGGLTDTTMQTLNIAYPTFTDPRDGNVYPYKSIGNQLWMIRDMAWLPSVSPYSVGSTTEKIYYVVGYTGTDVALAKASQNYGIYGPLYNGVAAQDACPVGWHTASDDEWKILEKYLGMTDADLNLNAVSFRNTGNVGSKLKEAGTSHWISPNVGANNSSGFTALPGNGRAPDGIIYPPGPAAVYWTGTGSGGSTWQRGLMNTEAGVLRYFETNDWGMSVRCVKNL